MQPAGGADTLDSRIESLIRDWNHGSDMLFSIHPSDGSLLIWLVGFSSVMFTHATVHYPQWHMPPFMRQCWGLPYRLAQCMNPLGLGKLVNASLLSLMRHVWVYAALPSSQVNLSAPLVCRHDRVTLWQGV